MSESCVEWISTTPACADHLTSKAVVGGYESQDGSPLWVIRSWFQGDLIPGQLAIKHKTAYVTWGGVAHRVENIEVCCACPGNIKWIQTSKGFISKFALEAGKTKDRETLYVGRANHSGSLIPGKVHPTHNVLYISVGGNEIKQELYELLCFCTQASGCRPNAIKAFTS